MRTLLVLLTGCLCAGAQELLRMEEAEARAVRNHPRIAAAAADAHAASAVAAQVRARQSLQLEAGTTASVAEHGTRLGIGGVNAPDLFSRYGLGVNVSQLISDFGRTALAARSADESARSRESLTKAAESDIRWATRLAYYRALQASASQDVAMQVRASRQVLLRQIQTFAENQLRSTLDVGFAEVRLSEAELLVVRSENAFQAALIDLASAMGMPEPDNWKLEEPASGGAVPVLDQAIDEAIRNRPEVESMRHQVEAARKQLESDRRLSWPTVGASGAGGFLPVRDPRIRPHYAGAAVNISVPILNGHAFDARRGESASRAVVAKKQAEELVLRLTAAVRLASLDVVTADKNLETTRKLREQAERTFRFAQSRYDAGLGSILEFNQAQVDAASAQLALATAQFEAGISRSRLDYTLGRLR